LREKDGMLIEPFRVVENETGSLLSGGKGPPGVLLNHKMFINRICYWLLALVEFQICTSVVTKLSFSGLVTIVQQCRSVTDQPVRASRLLVAALSPQETPEHSRLLWFWYFLGAFLRLTAVDHLTDFKASSNWIKQNAR
jgi:hypothetical protein